MYGMNFNSIGPGPFLVGSHCRNCSGRRFCRVIHCSATFPLRPHNITFNSLG
ncbi:hypothetical protein BDZ91DRAFT_729779 [Kalaharituber pfeilii]|nr:hypothetical protein BDZ91DRAFT_729779 [Kalaharituber pfeilii]